MSVGQMPPYAQEVLADDPLSHWRLNGKVEGAIKGDSDRATYLARDQKIELGDAGFGGPEVALELWLKQGRGRVLSYRSPQKTHVFEIDVDDTLKISLFGQVHDSGVALEEDDWQLLGISWRSSDGLLMVIVDGKLAWRTFAAKGRQLPFNGRMVLGGPFEGSVDEVAVFDQYKYAGHWLDRYKVGIGLNGPSLLRTRLPLRVVEQRFHDQSGIHSTSWCGDGIKFISAGESGNIKVWNTRRGKLIHDLNTDSVRSVACSPDTRWLASSNEEHSVRVWDLETGDLVHDLTDHKTPIGTVSWSPDGTKLVSSAGDPEKKGSIKVWDARTGEILNDFGTPSQGHTHVSWSPDGTKLASSNEEHSVRVWDLETGDLVHDLTDHKTPIGTVSWSPDGTKLVSSAGDPEKKGSIKVWDARTGEILKQSSKAAHLMSWSPDHTKLATVTSDETVEVRDAQTGALLRELEGPLILNDLDMGDPVYGIELLSWSPDGSKIAYAHANGIVMLWDVEGGLHTHTIVEHGAVLSIGTVQDEERQAHVSPVRGESIDSLRWSPDGSRLVSTSRYKINVLEVQTGEVLNSFQGYTFTVQIASWNSKGNKIASAGDDRIINIWDIDTGEVTSLPQEHGDAIEWLKWGSNDDFLISWDGGSGAACVWNVTKGKLLSRISDTGWYSTFSADTSKHIFYDDNQPNKVEIRSTYDGTVIHRFPRSEDTIHTHSWSPVGAKVVTLTTSGRVRSWSSKAPSTTFKIPELSDIHEPRIHWSPDGNRVLFLGEGTTSFLWNTETSRLSKLNAPDEFSELVSWSPDRTKLATESVSGDINLWDIATAKLIRQLEHPEGPCQSLEWNASSDKVFTIDGDGVFAVWDVSTGKKEKQYAESGGSNYVPATWSPDHTMLATVNAQGHIKVWDAQTGVLKKIFKMEVDSFEQDVEVLEWSHDSQKIASEDHAIKIWHIHKDEPPQVLSGQLGSVWLEWSADDSKLVSAGVDGTVKVWDMNQGQAVTLLFGESQLSYFGTFREDGGGSSSWLTITDDGFFDGSATFGHRIAVVQGSRVFNFEQLATSLNRSDKVLEALGAPEAMVSFHKDLWLRRLDQLGLSQDDVGGDFTSAPTTRILSTTQANSEGVVQIKLAFRDNVELRGYRTMVNGVPLFKGYAPLEGKHQRLSIDVQLTEGSNVIEISSLNARGIESLRESVTINQEGSSLPKPRMFFLGFGVSDYEFDSGGLCDLPIDHPDRKEHEPLLCDLEFAHKDAQDLAEKFNSLSTNKSPFSKTITKTYTNQEVVSGVLDGAREFLDQVNEHDTLIVFVAGHGVRVTGKERTFYYLSHNSRLTDLEQTATPFDQIEDLLYQSKARKKLLLIDTCQSGEVLNARLKRSSSVLGGNSRPRVVTGRGNLADSDSTRSSALESPTTERLIRAALRDRDRLITQELMRRTGAIVLAASLGHEASWEAVAWENGAFTKAILEALDTTLVDTDYDGETDTARFNADQDHDGDIITDELVDYVMRTVPRETAGIQHPDLEPDNPLQNFILATLP